MRVRPFLCDRSLARIALLLVGWAVAINLGLLALAWSGVFDWLPNRQTGAGFVLDNEQRVAGAIAEYRAGRVARDDYLVAVTGISNVREGVDVDILRRGLGPRVRVLGVAGAGAGASSIVDNARTLLDGGLRPDLVVIGIAPLQLLDRPIASDVATEDGTKRSLRDRVRSLVQRYVWLFDRRNDVSITVDAALTDARRWLFNALHVRVATASLAAPWRPMMRLMGADHYPETVLRAGLAAAGGLGAFDPRAYDRARESPGMIATLIHDLRLRGSQVAVVTTPEHSWLRDREPSRVMSLLAARLRRESGVPDLTVLDFRAAVPNRGFVDLSHLNGEGSRCFSAILARALSGPDRSRPPLMTSAPAGAPAADQHGSVSPLPLNPADGSR